MFGVADSDNRVDFFNELLLLIIVKVHVPLCQPRLASTVLDQNEAYLQQQTTQQIKLKFYCISDCNACNF